MTNLSAGTLAALSLPGTQKSIPGASLPKDLDVIASLVLGREDQSLAADLVQCVFEFAAAIRGIDVDQDEPRLGGGKLGQYPLGAIRRPDADPVAWSKSEFQETDREAVDSWRAAAIGPAHLLVSDDQRLSVGVSPRGAVEIGADGFLKQGNIGSASHVALTASHDRLSSQLVDQSQVMRARYDPASPSMGHIWPE